jgi:hypothetical protein
MWRVFWCSVFIFVGFVMFGIWASANVTFLYRHPQAPDVRIVVDYRTGAAVLARAVAQGQPQVEVPENEFDFGVMDNLAEGTHSFVVNSTGSAPLELRMGPTTCKCTVAGLANRTVPPGGSTTVTMQWNTGRDEHYAHSAVVYTNDSAKRSIQLHVKGRVRQRIGCDEPEILLERRDPDQPAEVERLLYSQLWDDFAITRLSSAIEGLQWEVLPVDPESMPEFQAKSVRRLRLTLPPSDKSVYDTLRVTIQPNDESQEATHFDLSLVARAIRRLSFYGPSIDDGGLIDMGNVREGQSRRVKLLAKVRDPEPELPAPRVEVFPAFLTASLTPHKGQKGLYDLTIELPADAPTCQYRVNAFGRLTIDSGHPRIGLVELQLAFAVVPQKSL